MLLQHVQQRLATVDLHPDLRAALVDLLAQHDHDPKTHELHRLPLDIYHVLGGQDEQVILPLVAAWSLLDITVQRLDHLQDDDPENIPLPTAPHAGASYNLVLALYVLADACLDDLSQQAIPAHRLLQLRRLWNDCILVSASGQHHDLLATSTSEQPDRQINQYQQIAHAKSGTLFALALSSAALLATDDTMLIQACHFIGDIFGALLQLADDFVDLANQHNFAGLTFPMVSAGIAQGSAAQHLMGDEFAWKCWHHIRTAYRAQVNAVLEQVKHDRLAAYVQHLFDTAFEKAT